MCLMWPFILDQITAKRDLKFPVNDDFYDHFQSGNDIDLKPLPSRQMNRQVRKTPITSKKKIGK